MPAFVGPVELESIESSAIFTVGDTFSLSPKSTSKASLGAGVINTGDYTEIQNLFNITNFEDADLIDQTKILNK